MIFHVGFLLSNIFSFLQKRRVNEMRIIRYIFYLLLLCQWDVFWLSFWRLLYVMGVKKTYQKRYKFTEKIKKFLKFILSIMILKHLLKRLLYVMNVLLDVSCLQWVVKQECLWDVVCTSFVRYECLEMSYGTPFVYSE